MKSFDELYFCPGPLIEDTLVTLSPEESRHLKTVKRGKENAHFWLTNGTGILAEAKYVELKKKCVVLQILKTEKSKDISPVEIYLAAGILKGNRYEWLIEKATELGIRQFIPLITDRVLSGKGDKSERWQNKIIAAMKQSKQTWKPRLAPAIRIENLEKEFPEVRWICFHEKSDIDFTVETYPERPPKVGLIIGPEGGFTETEAGIFPNYCLPAVHRLRTETAALASINLIRLFYYWKL